jgi:hypothetical protein
MVEFKKLYYSEEKRNGHLPSLQQQFIFKMKKPNLPQVYPSVARPSLPQRLTAFDILPHGKSDFVGIYIYLSPVKNQQFLCQQIPLQVKRQKPITFLMGYKISDRSSKNPTPLINGNV